MGGFFFGNKTFLSTSEQFEYLTYRVSHKNRSHNNITACTKTTLKISEFLTGQSAPISKLHRRIR